MESIGDSDDSEPETSTRRTAAIGRAEARARERLATRRAVIGLAVGLLLVLVGVRSALSSVGGSDAPAGDTMAMDAGPEGDRFAELASQKTNYCSLDAETVMGYADDLPRPRTAPDQLQ